MAQKISPDGVPQAASAAQQSREDRLKAALKANLAKRKAQTRARKAVHRGDETGTGNAIENRTDQKDAGKPED